VRPAPPVATAAVAEETEEEAKETEEVMEDHTLTAEAKMEEGGKVGNPPTSPSPSNLYKKT
jgi:hypothetical protein